MRNISWIFLILLGFAGIVEAQPSATAEMPKPKRWDVSGSVALFNATNGDNQTLYDDDWYGTGRFGAQIGYYWNEYIKTELEYARTANGSQYFQQFVRTPDGRDSYSQNYEVIHNVQQLHLRMTAQFRRNTWVHPYITGGVLGERDERRIHIDRDVEILSGGRTLIVPESNNGPHFETNVGLSLGGGAKFYTSQNTFFNAGMLGTWTTPGAGSISLLIGFGIDF